MLREKGIAQSAVEGGSMWASTPTVMRVRKDGRLAERANTGKPLRWKLKNNGVGDDGRGWNPSPTKRR